MRTWWNIEQEQWARSKPEDITEHNALCIELWLSLTVHIWAQFALVWMDKGRSIQHNFRLLKHHHVSGKKTTLMFQAKCVKENVKEIKFQKLNRFWYGVSFDSPYERWKMNQRRYLLSLLQPYFIMQSAFTWVFCESWWTHKYWDCFTTVRYSAWQTESPCSYYLIKSFQKQRNSKRLGWFHDIQPGAQL